MQDLQNLLTTTSSAFSFTVFIVVALLAIMAIIAWFVCISLFIKVAKMKGHYEYGGTGPIWFVGIFGTPFLVALYVLSLPDLSAEQGSEFPRGDSFFDPAFPPPNDPFADRTLHQPPQPYLPPAYSQPPRSPFMQRRLPPPQPYPQQDRGSRFGRRMW